MEKEIKQTYCVRDFPLHRETISALGRKTRQTYQPHEPVELTEAEAMRYQHLIQPQTKTQTESKK